MRIGATHTGIGMATNCHDLELGESHRILVSFATGDADDLLYLRYSCADPTCDWCVVEYGPDECKEVVRIADDLLTHEFYSDNSYKGGGDARTKSTPAKRRSGQTDFFGG